MGMKWRCRCRWQGFCYDNPRIQRKLCCFCCSLREVMQILNGCDWRNRR